MHAKTDSDGTTTSNPPSSPRRPVYYVQSPSRDSHDGDQKTNTTSFHSSPILSPTGSPPHSSHSSSRFSGSGKVAPGDRRKKGRDKEYCEAIEEEGLLMEEMEGERRAVLQRRCCLYVGFVVGFFVLFSFFGVVLWGASRNQKPTIAMKSMTFENLIVQSGTDASGVPTDMLTLNSTVKFTFRNTATFFGVHVSSTPLRLNFSQLTIATGHMEEFYQMRKSQRKIKVVVEAIRLPLYGGGSSMGISPVKLPVPLTLGFKVRSRAHVLGKLVKSKFYLNVTCPVVLDPKMIGKSFPLKNCTFT